VHQKLLHVKQCEPSVAFFTPPPTPSRLNTIRAQTANNLRYYGVPRGRFARCTTFCGTACTETDLRLYAADFNWQHAIKQQRRKNRHRGV